MESMQVSYVFAAVELSWKTFTTLTLRGQKHMKTPWTPVVFHDNSMEYSTWNFMENLS